jgi:hypothetical protein
MSRIMQALDEIQQTKKKEQETARSYTSVEEPSFAHSRVEKWLEQSVSKVG